MRTTSRPPDSPTRPDARPTRHDYGNALKKLRKWAGLTLTALEACDGALKVSTSSDYERGVRWPRWEWVHAYLTVCLTHRGLTDPVRLQAELAHWRTAWTHAHHHTQPTQPPPEADSTQETTPQPTGGAGPEAGSHTEAGENPARLSNLRSDPSEAHPERPPATMTIGSDGGPRTHATSTANTGEQLHQAAATPHEESHPPPDVTSVGHHRRWVLGAAAAVTVVTGVVVIATATGGPSGLTTTPSNGAVPPPAQTTISPPSNSAAPLPVQTTTLNSPPLTPRTELSKTSPASLPRQVLTPKTTTPQNIPPNQYPNGNTTNNSHNYVNNGVDNRGGTINGGIVAGGDVNNSGNTYNSYNTDNSYNR